MKQLVSLLLAMLAVGACTRGPPDFKLQIPNKKVSSEEETDLCAPKNGHTAGAGRWFGKNIGHFHPRGDHLGGRDYIPLLVPFPLEKHESCVIKNVNLFFHHPLFNKFLLFLFVTLFSEHCLDPRKIPGKSYKGHKVTGHNLVSQNAIYII